MDSWGVRVKGGVSVTVFVWRHLIIMYWLVTVWCCIVIVYYAVSYDQDTNRRASLCHSLFTRLVKSICTSTNGGICHWLGTWEEREGHVCDIWSPRLLNSSISSGYFVCRLNFRCISKYYFRANVEISESNDNFSSAVLVRNRNTWSNCRHPYTGLADSYHMMKPYRVRCVSYAEI